MDLHSISFTIHELNVLRQSLDLITINGKDAQFIANLQLHLDNNINEINNLSIQNQIESKKTTKNNIK